MLYESAHETAMKKALEVAEKWVGSTAPNPPVGAVVLDENGQFLASGAHRRAGSEHAEVAALEDCRRKNLFSKVHTLVVTLEPCAHQGKTPPCVVAIQQAGVKRVVFGVSDPNRAVLGNGGERLRSLGIEVQENLLERECRELIRGYLSVIHRGRPFVTMKIARRESENMIPPKGSKTFTSHESLVLAHQLRKRSDAIITGSGTVLSDDPLFTVRLLDDFPEKKRQLIVMDRSRRISDDWYEKASQRGLAAKPSSDSLEKTLQELAKDGVQEVLVEAGPTLVKAFEVTGLWDEKITIRSSSGEDKITYERRLSQNRFLDTPNPPDLTGP